MPIKFAFFIECIWITIKSECCIRPFYSYDLARIEVHTRQGQKFVGPVRITLMGRHRRRAISSAPPSRGSLEGRPPETKRSIDIQSPSMNAKRPKQRQMDTHLSLSLYIYIYIYYVVPMARIIQLHLLYIYGYIFVSSWSSCHAISTDIPDPLPLPFSIVHCFQ